MGNIQVDRGTSSYELSRPPRSSSGSSYQLSKTDNVAIGAVVATGVLLGARNPRMVIRGMGRVKTGIHGMGTKFSQMRTGAFRSMREQKPWDGAFKYESATEGSRGFSGSSWALPNSSSSSSSTTSRLVKTEPLKQNKLLDLIADSVNPKSSKTSSLEDKIVHNAGLIASLATALITTLVLSNHTEKDLTEKEAVDVVNKNLKAPVKAFSAKKAEKVNELAQKALDNGREYLQMLLSSKDVSPECIEKARKTLSALETFVKTSQSDYKKFDLELTEDSPSSENVQDPRKDFVLAAYTILAVNQVTKMIVQGVKAYPALPLQFKGVLFALPSIAEMTLEKFSSSTLTKSRASVILPELSLENSSKIEGCVSTVKNIAVRTIASNVSNPIVHESLKHFGYDSGHLSRKGLDVLINNEKQRSIRELDEMEDTQTSVILSFQRNFETQKRVEKESQLTRELQVSPGVVGLSPIGQESMRLAMDAHRSFQFASSGYSSSIPCQK